MLKYIWDDCGPDVKGGIVFFAILGILGITGFVCALTWNLLIGCK